MQSKATKRRRLSPEKRIDELLDTACLIIKSEGVAAATMQRIAQDSGVSKGLIYVYFNNQNELLQALMIREHKRFQAVRNRDAQDATSFDEMVRATQMDSWDYALNHRPFRDRLMAVPAVAEAMKDLLLKERRDTVTFLSKKMVENFNIPRMVAKLAVIQLTGIRNEDIKDHLSPAKMQEVEDIWSIMVSGAFQALEKKYGK
jgi:AcrR family transcriptional regulator